MEFTQENSTKQRDLPVDIKHGEHNIPVSYNQIGDFIKSSPEVMKQLFDFINDKKEE